MKREELNLNQMKTVVNKLDDTDDARRFFCDECSISKSPHLCREKDNEIRFPTAFDETTTEPLMTIFMAVLLLFFNIYGTIEVHYCNYAVLYREEGSV